ncbi:hypothetical protein HD554DRAFT_2039431 [Boletus coccyginus]|nr:hypothetical protein HD554DRAFT_2039431 [Boletus coccyginus]
MRHKTHGSSGTTRRSVIPSSNLSNSSHVSQLDARSANDTPSCNPAILSCTPPRGCRGCQAPKNGDFWRASFLPHRQRVAVFDRWRHAPRRPTIAPSKGTEYQSMQVPWLYVAVDAVPEQLFAWSPAESTLFIRILRLEDCFASTSILSRRLAGGLPGICISRRGVCRVRGEGVRPGRGAEAVDAMGKTGAWEKMIVRGSLSC